MAWVEVDPPYVWLTGRPARGAVDARGDHRADRDPGRARVARARGRGSRCPTTSGWRRRGRSRCACRSTRTPEAGASGQRASERARSALFGTDGVRGRANVHPMTAEMALALGPGRRARVRAAAAASGAQIIIGKDTRLSGYLFEDALAAGICSMGVDVLQVGPMPTPGHGVPDRRHALRRGRDDLGEPQPATRTTGSSSSRATASSCPTRLELRIEQLIQSGALAGHRADPDAIGAARRIDDVTGRYVVFLKKSFPRELSLDGRARRARLRARRRLQGRPDRAARARRRGVRDRRRAERAQHQRRAAARSTPSARRRSCARCAPTSGIALDGDADRCVMVDERGQTVDGDALLALLARDACERGVLQGGVGRRDRDEQPRPRARARARRARPRAHGGRRPLRRRGDARGRLQPRRRAVGPRRVARPQHHRRRAAHRAPGARDHAPHRAGRSRSSSRTSSACRRCS